VKLTSVQNALRLGATCALTVIPLIPRIKVAINVHPTAYNVIPTNAIVVHLDLNYKLMVLAKLILVVLIVTFVNVVDSAKSVLLAFM
jgi:hypothetical protein